jgi:hypothetical protein
MEAFLQHAEKLPKISFYHPEILKITREFSFET